jgi:hypothetical protein
MVELNIVDVCEVPINVANLLALFVAVHESGCGPTRINGHVRYSAAVGGQADINSARSE